jgi:hypothetical protein
MLVIMWWSAVRGVLDEGYEAGLLTRGIEHPNGNGQPVLGGGADFFDPRDSCSLVDRLRGGEVV